MARTAITVASLLICTTVLTFAFVAPRQHNSIAPYRPNIIVKYASASSNNELHLLTFDLDDTIFPIDPVIQDANSIMVQTLKSHGYNADNDEIIAASKRIRKQVRERGEEITYSDLRRGSIRCEMERLSTDLASDDVIEAVFNSWLDERHASANRNLFPHICSSLQSIRKQYPSVVIGAITNGRGNPFHMPDVAPYFDFCTSGEDDGVFPFRKPDRGIYEAALRQFRVIMPDCNDIINWIHVGDDLANDVGASAACGAKTIWLTSDNEKGEKGVGFWSTATPEEMHKRREMDRVAKQFVFKEIYALDGLIGAVEEILLNL
ncbi:hypothetical protein ACHAXN_003458 [Cyclotella atomus]